MQASLIAWNPATAISDNDFSQSGMIDKIIINMNDLSCVEVNKEN
jgi:hypothetical protein